MLGLFRNIFPILGGFLFSISEFLYKVGWIWSGNEAATMPPTQWPKHRESDNLFTTKISLFPNPRRLGTVLLPILTLRKGILLPIGGVSIFSTFWERSSSRKSSSGGWSCTTSVAWHKERKNNSKHALAIYSGEHISCLLFLMGEESDHYQKRGKFSPLHINGCCALSTNQKVKHF